MAEDYPAIAAHAELTPSGAFPAVEVRLLHREYSAAADVERAADVLTEIVTGAG